MRKIRIGIIGAGGIADRRMIPGMTLSERVTIVAVMDTNFEACKRIQEKYGIPDIYDDYQRLLENPQVEAVYIASPVFCHCAQVKAAADAGKHILCEKPFGLTYSEAKEMETYCRNKKVLLYAGFVMRFHNLHKRMREIVQSDALGKIVNIYANFSCWYPDNGSWRQKKASSGGGVLMDMAVHSMDLIRFITDDSFSNISALTRTRAFHYEVDDSASLLMELTGGGTCTVNSYFCIPDEGAASRFEIYGTRGVLKADNTLSQEQTGDMTGVIVTDEGKESMKEFGNTDQNMYRKEIEGFCDAIEGISSDIADATEMVYIQKIVQAAYESSETGERIHF